jgi:cell division protein FtsQ
MKKWLIRGLWIAFGIGVIVLMGFTKVAQEELIMDTPQIVIHVQGEHAFLTEDELRIQLENKGLILKDQRYEQIDIGAIEAFISSISVVKSVKVFTEIGRSWSIDVIIRKPIAHVFNKYKENFYLDADGHTMISPVHTARVVIVTGEIPDRKDSKPIQEIINNPALKSIQKLDDVYRISTYVCNDSLLSAQIGQIHCEKNGDFILIPQVGRQKIIFGSADSKEEVEAKFKKLKIFYKEGIPYEGWNKYEEINLKFNKQIVCKRVKG